MIHRLFVKRFLLPHLKSGRKKLEIRISTESMREIKTGDTIDFNEGYVQREVVGVHIYPDFEVALKAWEPELILPGETRESLLSALRGVYSKEKENEGVIIFELN